MFKVWEDGYRSLRNTGMIKISGPTLCIISYLFAKWLTCQMPPPSGFSLTLDFFSFICTFETSNNQTTFFHLQGMKVIFPHPLPHASSLVVTLWVLAFSWLLFSHCTGSYWVLMSCVWGQIWRGRCVLKLSSGDALTKDVSLLFQIT